MIALLVVSSLAIALCHSWVLSQIRTFHATLKARMAIFRLKKMAQRMEEEENTTPERAKAIQELQDLFKIWK